MSIARSAINATPVTSYRTTIVNGKKVIKGKSTVRTNTSMINPTSLYNKNSALKKLVSKINEGNRKGELPEFKLTLTPADCLYILENMNGFNRKMKTRSVFGYAQDMLNGRWVENTGNNIKFGNNGKLLDGQNRLRAVVDSNIPREFSFKFGLNPKVQGVVDTIATRTLGDTLGMAKLKYTTTLASTATMLGGFFQNPHRPNSRKANTPSTKAELEDIAFKNAKSWETIATQLQSLHIKNVVTESIATFSYFVLSQTTHANRVPKFFERLAIGADMSADNPVFVVRQRLIAEAKQLRSGHRRDIALALIFKAWNMHIAGEKANKLRTPDSIPVIKGLEKINGKKIYSSKIIAPDAQVTEKN